jgi:hypothetical protein
LAHLSGNLGDHGPRWRLMEAIIITQLGAQAGGRASHAGFNLNAPYHAVWCKMALASRALLRRA